MRLDRRPDAVLELRDDLARAVVGLRVGAEENHDIDLERDRIASDLYITLFEDVEEPNLHQIVEVRQLVHGKEPAVHPRDETEVQGVLAAQTHARPTLAA